MRIKHLLSCWFFTYVQRYTLDHNIPSPLFSPHHEWWWNSARHISVIVTMIMPENPRMTALRPGDMWRICFLLVSACIHNFSSRLVPHWCSSLLHTSWIWKENKRWNNRNHITCAQHLYACAGVTGWRKLEPFFFQIIEMLDKKNFASSGLQTWRHWYKRCSYTVF